MSDRHSWSASKKRGKNKDGAIFEARNNFFYSFSQVLLEFSNQNAVLAESAGKYLSPPLPSPPPPVVIFVWMFFVFHRPAHRCRSVELQVHFDGIWLDMNEPSSFRTNEQQSSYNDGTVSGEMTPLSCPLSGAFSTYDNPSFKTANAYYYGNKVGFNIGATVLYYRDICAQVRLICGSVLSNLCWETFWIQCGFSFIWNFNSVSNGILRASQNEKTFDQRAAVCSFASYRSLKIPSIETLWGVVNIILLTYIIQHCISNSLCFK